MKFLWISFLLLLFTGCMSQRVADDDFNQLTRCGAGYSLELSASLKAKVGANLKEGIDASAGVEDELRAAFLSSDKVTEENITELYKLYLGCLNK